MKAIKITFWVSTVIIGLMMLNASVMYITSDQLKAAFHHLGFPDYFRIELAVMKMIGVAVLLAPVPRNFKEWAYAGFTLTFVSAFIAHCVSGDALFARIMPVVFLAILLISYWAYHRLLKLKSQIADSIRTPVS